MFSNEKYKGSVRLLGSVNGDIEYLAEENNPPIISDEVFDRVQKFVNIFVAVKIDFFIKC